MLQAKKNAARKNSLIKKFLFIYILFFCGIEQAFSMQKNITTYEKPKTPDHFCVFFPEANEKPDDKEVGGPVIAACEFIKQFY